MIIREFFINFSILVTFIFLYTQISKDHPLTRKSPLRIKMLSGLYGGILSNILMQFSISIDTMILDLRQIPNIMLAYFGGIVPVSISVTLTILGRFLIYVNKFTYLSIIPIVLGSLFAWLFSKTAYNKRVKLFFIIAVNNLIFSIVFWLGIANNFLAIKVLTVYWIVLYISVYLSFYILCQIRKNQVLFQKYEQDSTIDGLTGLKNFRSFEKKYYGVVAQARGNNKNISVLYIDIDFFKKINDDHGHVEGNVVLKKLGNILQGYAGKDDIVGRIGGEEFGILLIDRSLDVSHKIAERIRRDVEHTPFVLSSGQRIHLTISIGVASYPHTTGEPEQLITDADVALYRAKCTGRNKVCIANYEVDMKE